MRRGNILLLWICLLSFQTGDRYYPIAAIAQNNTTFFTTDNLGNCYLVHENELAQYNARGKFIASSSEKNLGNLLYIDASNPLKLLLFYPDFARLVFLDSKLAEQSTIDLRALEINQPLTACTAEEGGYWIYDREVDQLKKLDVNQQVIQQSGNLMQVLGYQVEPGMMVQQDGLVYMNNPATGIVVFDRYGTYFKTIPYKNVSQFQVIENQLLFLSEDKLVRYDSKTVTTSKILLPSQDTLRAARIERNELYLLTTDSLKFYSF